jgi:hypothetical protein
MRILGMMVIMLLNLTVARAATVDLTDGRVVQGDIVKQDDKSLQINVDGVAMTYYSDEIKDIDGKPFAAPPAAAPAAPADVPVAQPAVMPASEANVPANPVDNAPATPAAPVTGTIDPEKRALILQFIDVFGTRQALINNFELMLQQIEKEKPDEAQKIRQRVKVDEIIEHLLPIYDRNFTSDDLKAFIAFYGSPEGKKLTGTIPELMKESVQESVKYMEEKFPEVNKGQQ